MWLLVREFCWNSQYEYECYINTGPREGMMITFSKDEECKLKIMYRNEDFEYKYTLWLVKFIWALFGNASSLFHIPHMKYDFVSFLYVSKQLTDSVASFPDSWSKQWIIGNLRFSSKLLARWRQRQWFLLKCWYLGDADSRYLKNVGPLQMQIGHASKMCVLWRCRRDASEMLVSWRCWHQIPPECWYLGDWGSAFAQSVGTLKMQTAVLSEVLVHWR